jgi:hypothetical protein
MPSSFTRFSLIVVDFSLIVVDRVSYLHPINHDQGKLRPGLAGVVLAVGTDRVDWAPTEWTPIAPLWPTPPPEPLPLMRLPGCAAIRLRGYQAARGYTAARSLVPGAVGRGHPHLTLHNAHYRSSG